jgi:hypothetical protein
MMPSYSQFGEDLLVNALFEDIGTRNQWCFEVGAHNGRYCSNTLAFREQGWTAILAESHHRYFEQLQAEYGDTAHCIHEHVTDLDALLERFEAPTDIDFGVIDVDGQDYWLWHDMIRYRPRVLLIEFSPYEKQETYDPANAVPRGGIGQTARQPLMELADSKGYEFVADTFCNLLFLAR